MKALEGHRGHITHIQFHSYGGGEGDENTFNSKVAPLADYVNSHDNITVDVGQVLFGETTSMTGDGPLGYFLSQRLRHQVVQRATPKWKPAAASRRSSTATRAWSTRCNGRSGWSGTCWSKIRGGS